MFRQNRIEPVAWFVTYYRRRCSTSRERNRAQKEDGPLKEYFHLNPLVKTKSLSAIRNGGSNDNASITKAWFHLEGKNQALGKKRDP